MSTYDLGDVVTLTCEVRDAAGAAANAGAVTCTVTAPDGTTSSPTVSNPATGTYTATYTPAVTGRFAVRWLATGANAGAFAQDFTVVSGAPLLTRTHLEAHLQRAVAAKDQQAADAACDYATALVADVLGFDPATATFTDAAGTLTRVSATDMTICRGIAVRIAAQWFTNPQDRASYSGPEGLSFTASQQMLSRIMSEADRRTLVGVQLRYAPGFA